MNVSSSLDLGTNITPMKGHMVGSRDSVAVGQRQRTGRPARVSGGGSEHVHGASRLTLFVMPGAEERREAQPEPKRIHRDASVVPVPTARVACRRVCPHAHVQHRGRRGERCRVQSLWQPAVFHITSSMWATFPICYGIFMEAHTSEEGVLNINGNVVRKHRAAGANEAGVGV